MIYLLFVYISSVASTLGLGIGLNRYLFTQKERLPLPVITLLALLPWIGIPITLTWAIISVILRKKDL